MPDDPVPPSGSDEDPARGRSGERGEDAPPPRPARAALSEHDRRRLAAIFGDVLPDTTSDERDPASPRRDEDAWYRENRPPHHDR